MSGLEELAQLSRWFDEGVSLITIGGIGGTGKTRLAREFGLHYAAKSKIQVWFVDCAGAQSVDDLVKNMAEVLGIQLTSATPEQQVGNALKARGDVLCIIDNVEQILPDATETLQLWSTLAERVDGFLQVVCVLGSLEQVLALEPFSTDDGVALFYARAQRRTFNWIRRVHSRTVCARLSRDWMGFHWRLNSQRRGVH